MPLHHWGHSRSHSLYPDTLWGREPVKWFSFSQGSVLEKARQVWALIWLWHHLLGHLGAISLHLRAPVCSSMKERLAMVSGFRMVSHSHVCALWVLVKLV